MYLYNYIYCSTGLYNFIPFTTYKYSLTDHESLKSLVLPGISICTYYFHTVAIGGISMVQIPPQI